MIKLIHCKLIELIQWCILVVPLSPWALAAFHIEHGRHLYLSIGCLRFQSRRGQIHSRLRDRCAHDKETVLTARRNRVGMSLPRPWAQQGMFASPRKSTRGSYGNGVPNVESRVNNVGEWNDRLDYHEPLTDRLLDGFKWETDTKQSANTEKSRAAP